jgi:lactate dehydrogenase-like 2-hydroxyacid dehydrogenase
MTEGTKIQEVVVSRPLALEEADPAWVRLGEIAKVHVRPLTSRFGLAAHPRLKHAAGVITMVGDRVDEEFLGRAPLLKVVANHAVGCDNIDFVAARARGILVCNTPDVLTNATAELTIGLMFAVARRFGEGSTLIHKRTFGGWHPRLLLGRELAGSTLGIVGLGRIGSAVAAKARALGMVVQHTNPAGSPNAGLPLLELLATSDFISLHCPLTEQTRSLLAKREFAAIKPGAFLINTARGELVDERALVAALRSGHLRGAALDVFHGEPHLNPSLRAHPRVFILPHLGSATVEARTGMARLAVNAVLEVLAGRSPANRVG